MIVHIDRGQSCACALFMSLACDACESTFHVDARVRKLKNMINELGVSSFMLTVLE